MHVAHPLLALLPLSLAFAIVAPIPDRPVAVERLRADYRENGLPDGRVLAELELVLFRTAPYGAAPYGTVRSGTWLEVRASAKGPRVDPGRGFQNIQGFNRQTTRDFEAILGSHTLEVPSFAPPKVLAHMTLPLTSLNFMTMAWVDPDSSSPATT